MLNFTSEVHCRARRLDVNARVRFPERFTFRAAVNCGASRADLEPKVGLVPQQGTELLMSIGPIRAPSSIIFRQKLQELCETNLGDYRIS